MRFIQHGEWDREGYCLVNTHDRDAIEVFYNMAANVPVSIATEAVNAVNNQGVSNVNIAQGTYENEGVTLGLKYLSTAERIFLVCEIFRYLQLEITLYRVLEQLDRTVLSRFFKRYKDCSNIIVIDKGTYYKKICERS